MRIHYCHSNAIINDFPGGMLITLYRKRGSGGEFRAGVRTKEENKTLIIAIEEQKRSIIRHHFQRQKDRSEAQLL